MNCSDKFRKRMRTSGDPIKVEPEEVAGRPLCDHAGCNKPLLGTGKCVDGHVQGVERRIAAQREGLEALLCVTTSLRKRGLPAQQWVDPQVAAAQRALHAADAGADVAVAAQRLLTIVGTLAVWEGINRGDQVRFTKAGHTGEGIVLGCKRYPAPAYIVGAAEQPENHVWHPTAQRHVGYGEWDELTVEVAASEVEETTPLAADPRVQAARALLAQAWVGPGPYEILRRIPTPGGGGAVTVMDDDGHGHWGEQEKEFDITYLRLHLAGDEATIYAGDDGGDTADFNLSRAALLELLHQYQQGQQVFELAAEGSAGVSGINDSHEWVYDRAKIEVDAARDMVWFVAAPAEDFSFGVPRSAFAQLCQDTLAQLVSAPLPVGAVALNSLVVYPSPKGYGSGAKYGKLMDVLADPLDDGQTVTPAEYEQLCRRMGRSNFLTDGTAVYTLLRTPMGCSLRQVQFPPNARAAPPEQFRVRAAADTDAPDEAQE